MVERLLTPREVADRLAVTAGAIREWIRVGKLKGVKAGRLWRIRERDLEQFLREPVAEYGLGRVENEEAGRENLLREYSNRDIREFLEADKISEETARKLERLLGL